MTLKPQRLKERQRCIINYNSRRVPNLLAAVLHLQHHGRDLHEARRDMSAWCHGIHRDLLAGIHEQLRKSRNLHCVQSRISQSLPQAPQLLNERRRLRSRLSWGKEEQRGVGQSSSSTIVPTEGIEYFPRISHDRTENNSLLPRTN